MSFWQGVCKEAPLMLIFGNLENEDCRGAAESEAGRSV